MKIYHGEGRTEFGPGVQMRPPWHREACWECGTVGLATRGEPGAADRPYLCEVCEILAREEARQPALREVAAAARGLLARYEAARITNPRVGLGLSAELVALRGALAKLDGAR